MDNEESTKRGEEERESASIRRTDSGLFHRLLPFYSKWIGDTIIGKDMRSVLNKCSLLSTMLVSSRYVNHENPYGFDHMNERMLEERKEENNLTEEQIKKERKEKEKEEKEKKNKKDNKGKDKDKNKKEKKGKEDKKDKKGKDKDKKEKKGKKGKKEKKDKKDKKEEMLPGKEDKDFEKLEEKALNVVKQELDAKRRLHTFTMHAGKPTPGSIGMFSPCMAFVKCPEGHLGEECFLLKHASHEMLTADKCLLRYVYQLERCRLTKKKGCLEDLKPVYESCKRHAAHAIRDGSAVLELEEENRLHSRERR